MNDGFTDIIDRRNIHKGVYDRSSMKFERGDQESIEQICGICDACFAVSLNSTRAIDGDRQTSLLAGSYKALGDPFALRIAIFWNLESTIIAWWNIFTNRCFAIIIQLKDRN